LERSLECNIPDEIYLELEKIINESRWLAWWVY
jgi:hypothetical protein